MGNIAAFFDIDGTLYRDSLLIEHFKKLIKYDVVEEEKWSDSLSSTYNNWGNAMLFWFSLKRLFFVVWKAQVF